MKKKVISIICVLALLLSFTVVLADSSDNPTPCGDEDDPGHSSIPTVEITV